MSINYDQVAEALHAEVMALIKPLEGRIAALEAERAKGLHFEGAFQRAQSYQRGALVLHGGHPFVALKAIEPADPTPGQSPSWQRLGKSEGAR